MKSALQCVVSRITNNKASGPDDIPAEVLKFSLHALLHRLHRFISCAWNSQQLPQQWKDANIITIYKRKRDRAECGNSRGISLLSAAGKLLARVMLRRLLTHVVDIVVPESQCGFRRQRSTIDMIFVARLLQEKCLEQHRSLFFAFIDLTKAFYRRRGGRSGRPRGADWARRRHRVGLLPATRRFSRCLG